MQFVLGGLTFPLTPEEITVTEGAHVQSYAIIGVGPISFPRGVEPTKIEFSGILPGIGQAKAAVQSWRSPASIVAQVSTWKAQNAALAFAVTPEGMAFPSVFVETWEWTVYGGMGDLKFRLALMEKRTILIGNANFNQTVRLAGQPQAAAPVPARYIPKVGETLQTIALRFYGAELMWQRIYAANVDVIGPDAQVSVVGIPLIIPSGGTRDVLGQ